MKIIVTGSIAYDYLMSFPGKFTEQILPEHLHRLSVSFLVDSMDKRRGGCAPNIAYTLALLGEKPYLMGTAGEDFGDYRQWLEAAGVDTSLCKQISGKFTASFFCSTDTENNQIASFYTGAMADAGQLSFRGVKDAKLAIISPNDPGAMVSYAEECRTLKIPFIFDPGQQCSRMSGEELKDGIKGAHILICNDYEFELIRQKTEMGEKGSTVITKSGQTDVPAVEPRRIADPTGVGDAFRGGLMKGFAMGLPADEAARIGSVAATYCLEHLGGTYHSYTWDEFEERYRQHFGALAATAK